MYLRCPTFTCYTFLAFVSSLLETNQMACLDSDLTEEKKTKLQNNTHNCFCVSKSPIKTKPAPVYLLITYQLDLIALISDMKS